MSIKAGKIHPDQRCFCGARIQWYSHVANIGGYVCVQSGQLPINCSQVVSDGQEEEDV